MNENVHRIDRALRVVAGLVVLYLGLVTYSMAWWGWLGLILLLTGAVGFCPVYRLFGVKTS